ncbi:hypothetical protein EG832_05295 [bacterium]|nr:hypothetical protein [bacterium]
MNKRIMVILVVCVLSIVLSACSGAAKETTSDANVQSAVTEAVAAATEPATASVNSEFPMLPDASNVTDAQGTLMYQTATSMTDTFNFYKKELAAKGLTENEILTLNDATVSQLVFTGSDNGKSLIVQMTKLSDSAIAVSIRYE